MLPLTPDPVMSLREFERKLSACKNLMFYSMLLYISVFGFGFKKIEIDLDSYGFGFKVSGFGSRFGFKMSGFAHHWYGKLGMVDEG